LGIGIGIGQYYWVLGALFGIVLTLLNSIYERKTYTAKTMRNKRKHAIGLKHSAAVAHNIMGNADKSISSVCIVEWQAQSCAHCAGGRVTQSQNSTVAVNGFSRSIIQGTGTFGLFSRPMRCFFFRCSCICSSKRKPCHDYSDPTY